MKKGFILLAVLSFFAFQSNAQLEIGPKFGFNFSSLDGKLGYWHASTTNKFEMTGMQRIAFGIGSSFYMSDLIKLSPELLISYKGAEFEAPSPNVILKYSLTYIEIPILANIGIFDDPLSYYAIIGPYLGYLVGGIGQEYGAGAFNIKKEPIEEFFTLSDNQEAQKLDIGLYLGGGVGYAFGPGTITGELRYGIGFMKINTDSEHSTYKTAGKNNNFSIMLGYIFYLEGK